MSKARKYMKVKYAAMSSPSYIEKKRERMEALKKARTGRDINTARDYLVMANAISGKDRIESRKRIITRGVKLENGSD